MLGYLCSISGVQVFALTLFVFRVLVQNPDSLLGNVNGLN